MNARIEKKDEIKRTITIGGTEYAMPKVAPDVYMDYLEARESIFASEEKHKMYTKAQFVQMMETICALYGNQFTVEQLKDAETGLSVSEIIMEFAMIEAIVGGEVDKKIEKMKENFPEGK